MDFLDIRKKAKERAQARAAQAAAKQAKDAAAPPAEGAAPGGVVVTDEDVIEGALAARLQGLPAPPGDAAVEPDPRFTTWRPGVGAPPALSPEAVPAVPPAPRAEEFTIVAPAGAAPPRARPAAALPEEPEPARDPLDEFFFHPGEAGPALPHFAAAAAPEERPAPSVREEYLVFLLGDEEYAVAIGRVREVIKAPPITDVPRAPAHVLGVVTVRGEVVAVLDPRRRLGLVPAPAGERQGKIVIVDAGEGRCGLLVDRVASVVRLLPGSIEPCPQGIAGQRSEFLAGIGRMGERLFTVIELDALLRRGGRAEAPVRARGADAGA
jgi:purine-binding chemotaxis protein CheW